MDSEPDDSLTDKGRLLFGAGFVFGVMATMLVMAVVVVVVSGRDGPGELPLSLLVTVLAGIVFAAIVGAGLYLLAFPENRTRIPIDPGKFERSVDEDGEN